MSNYTIDHEYLGKVVQQEIDAAESWMHSDLADEQADNIDYYYGEPFGNEEPDRSQVVTRDVLETVEGIMPDLMKIFTSSDQVVEFDPIGPQDEDRVEIQGRYINHVFMNRYNGYKIFYDWFKDALLMKNGILKVGWEKNEEVQFKRFEGLTKELYELIKLGEYEDMDTFGTEYEIESYEKYKEDGVELYDVRVKIMRQRGRPECAIIPSEEFLIKERSCSIKEAPFCAHLTEMTVGELLEMGFEEDEIDMALEHVGDESPVPYARFKNPDESSMPEELGVGGKYEKLVRVAEAYVRLYDEEDNKVKLYKCFHVGRSCLEYEEVDRVPFISLSPIMMPHKFVGVAVADLVRDIQEIRSTIFRQMLDNLALQNNGRYTAIEGQVNLQDLIDNKIGGIVRQKMPNAVGRLDTPDLSGFTVPVLEQLDLQKENRTGVSRMTAGLDPSALSSHQTAAAVNQVMSAAQGKILLIARNFAETGCKELFLELYNLIRENQTKPDVVPIEGRYAIVNPVEWTDRYDVHVTVGVGNSNKDQQAFHLQNISQLMQQIGGSPHGYLITAENVFNLASEFIKNSGYHNPVKFISHPSTVEPPPPPPNPDLIAAQAQMQRVQSEAPLKQAQAQKTQVEAENLHKGSQLDFERFNWEKKVNAAEMTLEASQERPVGVGTGK